MGGRKLQARVVGATGLAKKASAPLSLQHPVSRWAETGKRIRCCIQSPRRSNRITLISDFGVTCSF
ncbi:MAG: hypothetical protein KF868_18600 [Acidobacteria bacterium]|nr:hypothetical protein [Acidobacteriota bacterium]